MERVFGFTRRILEAAEREQLLRVLETQEPWAFTFKEGWTWYDYVRDLHDRTGKIHLFPSGGGPTRTTYGRDRLPARLAIYRGSTVVEEDVEDVGLLLRELQRTDEYVGRYSVSPLVLSGSSRTGDDWDPAGPPDKLSVDLELFTDIWFPRVIGLNAEDPLRDLVVSPVHPARDRDGLMDNSALARRHTPRLNRFIKTLREAVLELGGRWHFDRAETDSRYLPMIHEEGINLDPPLAGA